MAIVTEELQPAKRGFIVNATSADASVAGGELLLEDVIGGTVSQVILESHYLTSITIACISAITVRINDDSTTEVVFLGPVPFNTTSSPLTVIFPVPIKVGNLKSLFVTASGAGAICVVIQGYTE